MTKFIEKPQIIEAAGNKVKLIEEYFGRVIQVLHEVSLAKMESPNGWVEPGKCPEFDEYTVVLKGTLCVKTKEKVFEVKAGQAILIAKNEWVQ